MSGVSKLYSELYSPVRNDAPNFNLRWRFDLKICAVQNWLKTQPKNFLKNYEALEPVCWSQGGLHWKVILVSNLYIYSKYVFFFPKAPLLFDLSLYNLI
jgi:hypothetical protein